MGFLSSGARFLSSIPKGPKNRPPFESFYIYILALFIGYWIADLGTLYIRPSLLPTEPPPSRPSRPVRSQMIDISRYNPVRERNIFNEDGVIPPKLTGQGETGLMLAQGDAVPSQLPLTLEGTMVHSNPKRSVATITLKTKNEARAYTVGSDIEGMARVVRIERRKVIFQNTNNNRLEYIEIPKDTAVTFGMKELPQQSNQEVIKTGEFDFTMRRADINKYTADLGNVLQQARMVPNTVPGSGGRVDGFRFVAIQPGSIFEKLGFKPMDVIKRVNDEEVNSPTKAMELYNALKSEGRIRLVVERNGREEIFNYNVME